MTIASLSKLESIFCNVIASELNALLLINVDDHVVFAENNMDAYIHTRIALKV